MVYILLGTGFEETEAMAPIDFLRRARIPLRTVGIDAETVVSSHGVPVTADLTLAEASVGDAEMVILPGGMRGVDTIRSSQAALQWILDASACGAWIAAICAAPTILGQLGLLKGKKAVCYPGMESGMAGAEPQPQSSVVRDGKIITGRAAGSSLDFGLALIEALRGPEAADKVRKAVHYEGIVQ